MTTTTVSTPSGQLRRELRPRHYLMCRPTFFDVRYAINPWMRPGIPVDRGLAVRQWSGLVAAYRSAGHLVEELRPVAGLPDMVFAANGATVVDGQVLQARFAHTERSAEAAAHRDWHGRHGHPLGLSRPRRARAVNEGEGDFAVLADRVLAGWGFRTSRAAHAELAALTGREVISLQLVDPRFYHLDIALAVLDDRADQIAYYPAAFAEPSRHLLAERFPDALIAEPADAYALGLNLVSDGLHVFLPAGAAGLAAQLAAAGYRPVPIELGELAKGGGSVKCCTQEIRPARPVGGAS